MDEFNSIADAKRQPLYVQAIEALEKLIKGNKLKPGEQLPSEEALAKKLGVSRSTLREALGHLETHGLIYRRQGIGTFVAGSGGPGFLGGMERLEPFRNLARKAGVESTAVEREVGVIRCSAEIATMLGIVADTELIRVQVVEAIDSVRCMYVDDYIIPQDQEEEAQVLSRFTGSVLTYMIKERLPMLSHTRTEIFAIDANEKVAARLDVPVGKAVLHTVETYFSNSGEVLGLGLIYFLTERFHFYINRRVI